MPSWIILYSFITLLVNTGCKKNGTPSGDPITYGNSFTVDISTDKSSYHPGETVKFTLNKDLPASAKVRYRKLNETISETTLTGRTWQWTAPAADFTGYMVDVYEMANNQEKIDASIAVDISSDWGRFPRYGFLSKFGQLSTDQMLSVMTSLNRYHINGLQFYDWEYEHHQPLAGTVTNPAPNWKDIANRDTYKATVQQYISLAHGYGMKAMSYNLCYGALSNASSAGVADQWYMYTDPNHNTRSVLDAGSFLKSKIYLMDPSNTGWQNYIAAKTNDVYAVYDFDGYHVDQLGDWGKAYNYTGSVINVEAGFGSFLSAMKTASPNKKLVMNAVNQYGQSNIANAPVDFLYSEVWAPNEGYKDLSAIIAGNDAYSNNTKRTVLTAYMNYNQAANPGTFNTPAVLLTDAVIFSFGGAHLELGEHMLGKEYFPNSNLQMKDDLRRAMIKYYDFSVAYENLLRDGGSLNTPAISCTNGKMTLNNWPPQNGQVSVVGRTFTNRQVLHFINLASAASFDWRDTNGNQTVPNTLSDAAISFTAQKTVSKIWVASPDENYGVSRLISFTQSGNTVSFTLPSLQYWDMVVVDYQ